MRRPPAARPLAVALGAIVLLGAGCRAARPPAPEAAFGQREAGGEAETLLIEEPEQEAFFTYPAPVTGVTFRAGPAEADGRRPVELLIKGALPDACSALHDIRQRQAERLLDVTLEMRRPKGAVCAQVVRPYRFYYILEEPLEPGNYTLGLNGGVWPFTVRPAAANASS